MLTNKLSLYYAVEGDLDGDKDPGKAAGQAASAPHSKEWQDAKGEEGMDVSLL